MVVFDVIEDILLRSDVKDLVPWKTICKSWYSLISSPSFVKAHLKKTCNKIDSSKTNTEVGHTRIAMPKHWKTNNSSYKYNPWRVVGSFNGLVCIAPLLGDDLLVVFNPLTREIRKLPRAPLVTEKDKGKICLSFGYDSSSDDYKVLLGIKKCPLGKIGALFLIFSFKSNTWKLLGQFKYWVLHIVPGIFFNGAFHWFGFDYNASEQKLLILSFDLSREEFNVIPHPNDSRYVRGLSLTILGIFDDQLCISYTNKDNNLPRDIWVMRSYNVEQSWELLPDCKIKHEAVHFMKMIHYSSPMKNKMSFFCDDNKSLLKDWAYLRAPKFVPSLVSPYVNIGKPNHPKNKKTSVKAWDNMTRFRPLSVERKEAILENYRLEVGETENLYLYEDGK